MSNLTNFTLQFEEEIGGVLYVLKYLVIYLPFGILYAVGFVLGIIGNVLIGGSILTSKNLRNNPTFILILNLAVADFNISFIVDAFKIFGMLIGKRFFDTRRVFCQAIGTACLISCITSLVTMGFLAINRVILIIFVNKARYFTKKVSLILCVLSWNIALLLTLPNYFGFGDFVYDLKILSCAFDRLKIGYSLTFSVAFIIIPCCLIAFCYLMIFCYVYRAKAKLKHDATSKSTQEAIKIAKSLFASFALFAICWIPAGIIFIFDFDDIMPITAHTFTILPAHLNSAINPIFYGIFNPKMKLGYIKFINLICFNCLVSKNSSERRLTQTIEMSTNRKNGEKKTTNNSTK